MLTYKLKWFFLSNKCEEERTKEFWKYKLSGTYLTGTFYKL